ncbi:MAG: hypothetical protein H7A24_00275 [Leptospiraceae bacterium]|nr:hypothetical protein [Leptospiraceae bacterium]MCP5510287.1 hypothetical protein [Leptospiraceae bacterium]
MKLLMGAAESLITYLRLPSEEATQIIVNSIKQEMKIRGTDFGILEVSSKAERTAFTRVVVHRVKDYLSQNYRFKPESVNKAMDSFVAVLHRSWQLE